MWKPALKSAASVVALLPLLGFVSPAFAAGSNKGDPNKGTPFVRPAASPGIYFAPDPQADYGTPSDGSLGGGGSGAGDGNGTVDGDRDGKPDSSDPNDSDPNF